MFEMLLNLDSNKDVLNSRLLGRSAPEFGTTPVARRATGAQPRRGWVRATGRALCARVEKREIFLS